jgi:hypothetical protein
LNFKKILARKRRGQNAYGVVLYAVLLGAAFTLVNDFGVAATQLVNPNAPNINNIAPAANCGVSASGLSLNCSCPNGGVCGSNLGVSSTIAATVFTFGYFVWSFIKAFPVMLMGMLVPGSIATAYFGSGIGIVVNAGFFLLLAFWAWEIVGNRNTRPE